MATNCCIFDTTNAVNTISIEEDPKFRISLDKAVCTEAHKRTSALREDYRIQHTLDKSYYNFPLPRIDSIIEKVGGSKYFSSLDMANGYLQLRLDDESSYKCGFTTEDKVYAYTHLPFGLKSAASYFQRALRTILAGLEKDVLVYIDDVLVFSKTFESHVQTLKKVLSRFRAYNLKASPAKCEFVKKSITFLGHEINECNYSPNEANLHTIKQLPVPTDAKGVLRFLGMAGFFRKFIKNFSNIADR
uniref:Reverse transcriptase domain-containing protein n=1 Tax=Caenorhabditis japonica TaxID=281687 RepID=A0A8R1E6D8_CAEJA